MHYYNEFNLESAAMLKQMMQDGIIPTGDIDTRSIKEVKPDELKKYKQCHFFAGIGGWAIALRMAGVPESANVWTGSCPCQPFSSAGKQRGKEDDRHLWPIWFSLIQKCRPATIFGEQVASAITHGWLDDVYQGLEPEGYAVGSAVLPACSVGSPTQRYRLWFVGHAEHNGRFDTTQPGSYGQAIQHNQEGADSAGEFEGAGCASNVANTANEGLQNGRIRSGVQSGSQPEPQRLCGNGVLADAERIGFQGQGQLSRSVNSASGEDGQTNQPIDVSAGGWHGEWINCPDGKQRLIEPGIPLLAHGLSNRRPILHAIGNAIVPQVAAEFIKASYY